jgi:hypothetical protein
MFGTTLGVHFKRLSQLPGSLRVVPIKNNRFPSPERNLSQLQSFVYQLTAGCSLNPGRVTFFAVTMPKFVYISLR